MSIRAIAASAIVGVAVGAAPAVASPVAVGDYIQFADGPGNLTDPAGGEFIAQVLNGGSFRTFCLEVGELITFGPFFEVVGISDRVIWGGVGPEGDPLDSRTAFLYQQFALGTLADYSFTADGDQARINSANALQQVIWFLEDEIASPTDGISDADTLARIASFLATAESVPVDFGLGLVRVANLQVLGSGARAQDVLVLIPLPHAAGLGMAGLLGVMGVRRRR